MEREIIAVYISKDYNPFDTGPNLHPNKYISLSDKNLENLSEDQLTKIAEDQIPLGYSFLTLKGLQNIDYYKGLRENQ